jgi:hypothetical protein
MVNRTEAQAVVDAGLPACFQVTDDVRGVEQAHLPQAANGALVAIGRKHPPPESPLMNPHSHVAVDIATLERIVDRRWFRLVEVAEHLSFLHENGLRGRVIVDDEAGKNRLVPPRSRRHEVRDRYAENARLP